jgi:hypothetical protein
MDDIRLGGPEKVSEEQRGKWTVQVFKQAPVYFARCTCTGFTIKSAESKTAEEASSWALNYIGTSIPQETPLESNEILPTTR